MSIVTLDQKLPTYLVRNRDRRLRKTWASGGEALFAHRRAQLGLVDDGDFTEQITRLAPRPQHGARD